MRRILYTISALAAFAMLSSCDEWEPVFTFDYGEADVYDKVTLQTNTTIAELKAMYASGPTKIETNVVIGGQVVSEDKSGNVYKSLYIQDDSGAIELKLGKSGLYNDYKLGQWVYVKCSGLTLGKYNGMLQLGFADPTGEYETSYLDVDYFISNHVFRGELGTPLEPKKVAAADLLKEENLGCYVELDGLKYGSKEHPNGEIFCLIYLDSNKDKKSSSNRVFLSGSGLNYAPVADPTWGVTTWAMSKQGFLDYLRDKDLDGDGVDETPGNFNEAYVNDGSAKVGDETVKKTLIKNASAYSVSHYFLMDGKEVQIRTSGYARFADTQIDQEILDGATINVKGILTIYSGAAQFTLIDLDGVTIAQ